MTEREKIERYVAARPEEPQAYQDALALYKAGMDRAGGGVLELYGGDGEVLRRVRADQDWHDANRLIRAKLSGAMRKMAAEGKPGLERMNELYYQSLLMDARVDFDAFMLYLEKARKPGEKFYLPRRRVLRPIVEAFQEVADGKLDLLTVSQPKRTGKAVPVDTKVLTPNGYVRIGNLKVGDQVISIKGNRTIVTGVYPQGKKQVYRVTFGESGKCRMFTTIECCKDHLWTVQTEEDRANGHHRVMSTEDMLNGTMHRGHDRHRNYSVDYVQPVQFEPHGELLIKPYTMGVLIAEGGFTGGSIRISMGDELIVSRVTHELSDIVKNVGKYDYAVVSKEKRTDEHGYPVKSYTGQALVRYGLWEKYAYEKHIPEEYLYAPIEDRIELMRGLFDSDGSAVSNGCEYSTTSKQLAADVCFLVRSLGGRCRITERMGYYKVDGKKKETRVNYRVFCKLPNTINPFYIHRKAMACNSRMEKLHHFIESIEPVNEYKEMICISVEDESKQYIIGDSMIPTHNTTVGTWFVLFRAGQSPNGSSVCSGAGDMLVKSFYVGMLDVLQQKEKYAFYDIFPEAKLVSTNADEKTFNLKEKKRFATVTCRPIDGQITGSTEATPDGLIYLDDTVKNEEEAVNRDRLDFLWDKVRGDILGRRIEGCPIVAQGTRYSLYDPIGRLQEVAPNMGWRTKVLEIPALNENDESNFEITQNGKRIFTSAYYQHERELVTEMQWESQFQQHPFEAKGRLFPENALNRYFELPPNRDPDTVVAVCDTAEKGTDSVMMPIAYVYGEDIYIEDCVFNNGTPQYTKPECAHMLIKHKVVTCTFESNSAGEYFGRDVEKLVKDAGYRINIRMKRTISNKQNRIENASDGILKHFFFKDRSLYTATSEYGAMIRELTGYTRSGKVAHDDAPDGLSLLENELRGLAYGKVEVFARPF